MTELYIEWFDGTVIRRSFVDEPRNGDLVGIANDPLVKEFRVRRNG